MFESLTEKLQGVFSRLRGKGKLSEQDVSEALREVRLALLEADVNFKVVKDFVARVKERAVGAEVLEGLNPVQAVVKIVNDELIALLGGSDSRVHFAPRPPTIIMLCGLQGSGKTTTCGKLAHWMRRQGRNPLMVACDVYRPAAIKQLQVLGEQLKVPVFAMGDQTAPMRIAQEAVRHADQSGNDVIILDTAGRLHIDAQMMHELEEVKAAVNPTETLLIVDAMSGQDAVNFAQQFHEQLAVDGFLMTKMDGDARGGAALSIRSVTGVPIKFIGVGEKLDALEPFHPDRLASRILGMGDVLSLIERVQQNIDQEKAEEMERNLKEGRFDLNDYLEQMQQMKRLGPMDQIIKMIPGLGAAVKDMDMRAPEATMKKQEALVRSMTAAERSDPAILNGSRKRRIAVGAGVTVQEINEFLKQFEMMKQMIKQMTGGKGFKKKTKGPGGRMRIPFKR
jgi:signal recognition particle subunit SRP54